jgi:hypothetical protein
VGGTYDLRNDVVDQEGDSLTFVKTAGSWPSGVSMASNGVITATSGVSAGASGITVTADDGTNSPVASSSFSVTVPSSTAKRWNPGHYVKTTGHAADSDQTDYWNGVNSKILEVIEDIPEIKGAFVTVAWGAMNTTGSTFDWTEIDNTLSLLSARGKKMILEVTYKSFTGGGEGVLVPTDLRPADPTSRGWWGGVHRTATMTRFIAALQAVADRYDNNPDVEMVVTAETSPSFAGSDPPDYDRGDYVVQLKRMYDEAEAMFTKINYCPSQNYLSGYTSELLEYAYNARTGVSAPDARPDVVTWQMFENDHIEAVRDYRGKMARPAIISSSTIHDGLSQVFPPVGTPAHGYAPDHIDRCQQQSCTHVSWITWSSLSGSTWSDIKTAIQADPTLHTACPTQYGSCEV